MEKVKRHACNAVAAVCILATVVATTVFVAKVTAMTTLMRFSPDSSEQ